MSTSKTDILIARHGGGVNPDYILHIDLRIAKSNRSGKKTVKQIKLLTVLELHNHGSERLLNEKLIELQAGITDANERLIGVDINPVRIVLDVSENPIYKPPTIDGGVRKYQILIGGNVVDRSDAGNTQVSRSAMMSTIKPYFDIAIETGQTAKVVFMDKSDLGLELQQAVKSAGLKPIKQSADEFSVQAETKQEALALLGCLGIYNAVKNIGFGTGGGEIEYPTNKYL